MSSTWSEDADGNDLWGDPAATIPDGKVHAVIMPILLRFLLKLWRKRTIDPLFCLKTQQNSLEQDARNMPMLGSGPEYRGVGVPAQWIWMGGKSQAGHNNVESADSVYCRRKISCRDPEFASQVEFTGYKCESAYVNQSAVQEEAKACGEEVKKGESEVSSQSNAVYIYTSVPALD